jgi:hypothetical protein
LGLTNAIHDRAGFYRITNVNIKSNNYSDTVLINPGFEADSAYTQVPIGWSELSDYSTDIGYVDTVGCASGKYKVSHWTGKFTKWNMYTYKTFTGLKNGTYSAEALVCKRGTGIVIAQFEAKDFGGAQVLASIPGSDWTTVKLPSIKVTNNSCTIGLWTVVEGGNKTTWASIDDVKFSRNEIPGTRYKSGCSNSKVQLLPHIEISANRQIMISNITNKQNREIKITDLNGKVI